LLAEENAFTGIGIQITIGNTENLGLIRDVRQMGENEVCQLCIQILQTPTFRASQNLTSTEKNQNEH
jgi:hypothetical protein